MSSTRSIIAPPPFAANALTVIPPTPVAGVSYRDAVAGPASSPDGWPYAERVNSAEFNQILYQLTSLLAGMDVNGTLGYTSLVNYAVPAICFGSDGKFYKCLQPNGPATTPRDPISNPTFWKEILASGLVNVQVFDSSGTYTPSPGATIAIADVQGGGGQGGGSPAGNATQIGFGTGGHSGSRLVGRIPLAGITSLAITVGAGGTTGVAGAAGQTGQTSSVGTIITCPGGAGGSPAGPTAGPTILANSSAYPIPSSTIPVIPIISQQGNGGPWAWVASSGIAISGTGGASPGYGLNASANIGTGTGSPGTQKGQGGSGGFSAINAAAQKGGDGAPGKVIIWEY